MFSDKESKDLSKEMSIFNESKDDDIAIEAEEIESDGKTKQIIIKE